jgi:hypothetical protein
MHSRKPYNFSLTLILVICATTFVFQSCDSSTPSVAPTFTVAPLTFTSCPEVTPIVVSTKKPKVIYVLIDRSGSFASHIEKAKDDVIKGLESSIEPGDILHLIWLGAYEDQRSYLLVQTVPTIDPLYLTQPVSTLTFASVLPSTSTSEPEMTNSVLKSQALTQTAIAFANQATVTAAATNIIATNTNVQTLKDINQEQCAQAVINSQNEKLIESWQQQESQITESFIQHTLEPLMDNPPPAEDQTHIYNSLFYASMTITQEKETNLFGSYYLIILSDMEDRGSKKGEALQVDLSNVNVLIADVPQCGQAIDCQNKQDYWTQYFKDHNAVLPKYPFWLEPATTPSVISNFFEITGGSE